MTFEEWIAKAPSCMSTTKERIAAANCGWDARAEIADAELARQSDHYASCLAPLMDAVTRFLDAWDSRADVNDHVERIRKAMKGERGAADVSHKDDQRSA